MASARSVSDTSSVKSARPRSKRSRRASRPEGDSHNSDSDYGDNSSDESDLDGFSVDDNFEVNWMASRRANSVRSYASSVTSAYSQVPSAQQIRDISANGSAATTDVDKEQTQQERQHRQHEQYAKLASIADDVEVFLYNGGHTMTHIAQSLDEEAVREVQSIVPDDDSDDDEDGGHYYQTVPSLTASRGGGDQASGALSSKKSLTDVQLDSAFDRVLDVLDGVLQRSAFARDDEEEDEEADAGASSVERVSLNDVALSVDSDVDVDDAQPTALLESPLAGSKSLDPTSLQQASREARELLKSAHASKTANLSATVARMRAMDRRRSSERSSASFDVDTVTSRQSELTNRRLVELSRSASSSALPVKKKKKGLLGRAKEQLKAKLAANYRPVAAQIEGDSDSTRVVKAKYVEPMLSRYQSKLKLWLSRGVLSLQAVHAQLKEVEEEAHAEEARLVRYGNFTLIALHRAWLTERIVQLEQMALCEELRLVVLRSRLEDVRERLRQLHDDELEPTHAAFFLKPKELFEQYPIIAEQRELERQAACKVREARLRFDLSRASVAKETHKDRQFRLQSVLERTKLDESHFQTFDDDLQSVFNTIVLDQRTKAGRQLKHLVRRLHDDQQKSMRITRTNSKQSESNTSVASRSASDVSGGVGDASALSAVDVLEFIDRFTDALVKHYSVQASHVPVLDVYVRRAIFPHIAGWCVARQSELPGADALATQWRQVTLRQHGITSPALLELESARGVGACLFPQALQHLERFVTLCVPMDMARCSQRAVQQVYDAVTDAVASDAAQLGADELFPLVLHTIAFVRNASLLHKAAVFVDEYWVGATRHGECSYCFTTLMAALACLSRSPDSVDLLEAVSDDVAPTSSASVDNIDLDVVLSKPLPRLPTSAAASRVSSETQGSLPSLPSPGSSMVITTPPPPPVPPIPMDELDLSADPRLGRHFHASVKSSAAAEEWLANRPVNTFILRPSSRPNAVSVSFVDEKASVQHIRISYTERGYSLDGSKDAFETMHRCLEVYGFI